MKYRREIIDRKKRAGDEGSEYDYVKAFPSLLIGFGQLLEDMTIPTPVYCLNYT